MKLGSLTLPTDLILAPLMDVSTPSFRQLIYDLGGVGMAVTPMLFVPQFIAAPKTILPHLEHWEAQRPFALQIVANGRNPQQIRETLDYLNSYHFDVIDINAGCPAPHTMKSGGGGGFLREYHQTGSYERLQTVVNTCLKYSDSPVSLKTRLGFERATDIFELIPFLNASNLEFLTLHGRTIRQKYSGTADYEKLGQVQEKLDLPFVANGDVRDYPSYARIKQETRCDAVMIGRAAMFNPALFSLIHQNQLLAQRGESPQLSWHSNSVTMIRAYLKKIEGYITDSSKYWNNERFKLAEVRRLAIWFVKGIPGYKQVRAKLSHYMDFSQLKGYIFSKAFEDGLQPPENNARF